jgi:BD-FAE
MKASILSSGTVNQWLLVLVVVLVAGLGGLVAACGAAEATTSSGVTAATIQTTTSTQTSATIQTTMSSQTTVTTQTTAIASPAHEIQIFKDIRFMSERTADRPPLLDVYAPKQAGPWPLVVMLPGGFEHKDTYMSGWATKVAERGAVVFVPDWIRIHDMPPTPQELEATLKGMIGDIAAAVRFARGTGAQYGGDPGNLTLFGHSNGAMGATMEAFSGAPASADGLEGAGSTIPDSLVVFDGDYLLGQQDPWDNLLAQDPGLMQVYTPWQYLGKRVDFPVTVIGSGDPNLSRELGDPWAKDSWLAVRDPSGDIRRGLEELGALAHVNLLNEDMLKLFVQRLQADGDTVTYVRLTGSTHADLSAKGMGSLLEALVPGQDPAAATGAVVEKLMTGWNSENPDALMPLFADERWGYDAMFPDWTIDKQQGESMLKDPDWWKNFDLQLKTYFVSADGRFAAMVGVISIPSLGLDQVPAASLYAFRNGQVNWEYDYYGGAASQTEPAPNFTQATTDPGSTEATAARADATATLKQWVAAYNGRDSEVFLSSYAETAKYVDMVSPEWRVMTKTELAADVTSHFPRAEFKSSLAPSPASTSPLVEAFFVSADGCYAAAQGSYQDTGVNPAQPVLVLLMMEDGKIAAQYNLMLTDGGLLHH